MNTVVKENDDDRSFRC